jgi:hypothetical protein
VSGSTKKRPPINFTVVRPGKTSHSLLDVGPNLVSSPCCLECDPNLWDSPWLVHAALLLEGRNVVFAVQVL